MRDRRTATMENSAATKNAFSVMGNSSTHKLNVQP
jgi:hypothetical protein